MPTVFHKFDVFGYEPSGKSLQSLVETPEPCHRLQSVAGLSFAGYLYSFIRSKVA